MNKLIIHYNYNNRAACNFRLIPTQVILTDKIPYVTCKNCRKTRMFKAKQVEYFEFMQKERVQFQTEKPSKPDKFITKWFRKIFHWGSK